VVPAEADIKKLTIQDVKDFYAGNFGAQRAHLYVAGKFDAAAVKKAIAESFTNWNKARAHGKCSGAEAAARSGRD